VSPQSNHRVLIVASDSLLAALVGALAETAGLTAAFPQEGEGAADALIRVKPLVAVLVDGDGDAAGSDVFLARARKRGVAVMFFGERDSMQRLSPWARANDVGVFVIPAELDALHSALQRLPPRPGALRSERRARAERSKEGQLLFYDATGRRWSVYDRRGNDRRHPVHRSFVSEVGEAFGCDLEPGQESADSAEALESQLAHARPEQG
jgi:hypothetical protein